MIHKKNIFDSESNITPKYIMCRLRKASNESQTGKFYYFQRYNSNSVVKYTISKVKYCYQVDLLPLFVYVFLKVNY